MSRTFKTKEELETYEDILDKVQNKTMTLRQAAMFLEYKTGKKISHEGIRKAVKRRTPGLGTES